MWSPSRRVSFPAAAHLTSHSDLEKMVAWCTQQLPETADGVREVLTGFCVRILEIGHETVSSQIRSPAAKRPIPEYSGLDLGLERDSDRALEVARENQRVPAALPSFLQFAARVLRLTDLFTEEHAAAAISIARLPPGLLGALAEGCGTYALSTLQSSDACRACLQLVSLLAGPLPGLGDEWDSPRGCTEAPAGHLTILQAVHPTGLHQMIQGLTAILMCEERSDLRDVASRAFVRLCFSFGAHATVQALLQVLATSPQSNKQVDQYQKLCSQIFSAALAANWRKVRSFLKTLAK